jgi:hypothetical protein
VRGGAIRERAPGPLGESATRVREAGCKTRQACEVMSFGDIR